MHIEQTFTFFIFFKKNADDHPPLWSLRQSQHKKVHKFLNLPSNYHNACTQGKSEYNMKFVDPEHFRFRVTLMSLASENNMK